MLCGLPASCPPPRSKRLSMMICGWSRLHHRVGPLLVPGRGSAVVVEPQQVDLAVVGEQFRDLGLHALDELRVPGVAAVRIAPVHRRVIPADA